MVKRTPGASSRGSVASAAARKRMTLESKDPNTTYEYEGPVAPATFRPAHGEGEGFAESVEEGRRAAWDSDGDSIHSGFQSAVKRPHASALTALTNHSSIDSPDRPGPSHQGKPTPAGPRGPPSPSLFPSISPITSTSSQAG